MKFPRKLPHFRSLKFAPFAILSFFLFTNLTGFLFSRALAPDAIASPKYSQSLLTFRLPVMPQLDRIIFEAGQNQGVDPRLLHAVIWQESKYKVSARSHAGAQGLMQLIPRHGQTFWLR